MSRRTEAEPPRGAAVTREDGAAPLAKAAAAIGDAVAALTRSEGSEPRAPITRGGTREDKGVRSALGGVIAALAAGARSSGRGAVVGGTFLADLLTTTATRLPLRDKASLLDQHPGSDTEDIADSLEQAAARVSAAIGGAAGGLAAAQWLATPSLLAVPVELAAETLLVAAVELKLVAELHEIYGARPHGDLGQRGAAYLGSWTAQRGLRSESQTTGLASMVATAGSAAVRKRIAGRLARNLGSFLPFLAGAVIGSRSNAAGTRKLSTRLRADLSGHPEAIASQRVD